MIDSAIRESDAEMKQAQKGGPRRDAKKAVLAEAMEAAGADDVDAALEFVEAAEESFELGVDISDQLRDIGQLSKDDLEAKGEFTASQNSLVEKGILSVMMLNQEHIMQEIEPLLKSSQMPNFQQGLEKERLKVAM